MHGRAAAKLAGVGEQVEHHLLQAAAVVRCMEPLQPLLDLRHTKDQRKRELLRATCHLRCK